MQARCRLRFERRVDAAIYWSALKTTTRTESLEHGVIAIGSTLLVGLLEGQAVQKNQNSIETPFRPPDKPNKRHNLTSLRESFDLTVRPIGAEMGLPQRGRTHGGSTIAECHSSIDS
jgi:hypothetical protein